MLVHTADLHIGAFSDISLSGAHVRAFREVAEYVREHNIKYLVISGDLFERPKLENYSLLRLIVRELRKLRERCLSS